MTAKLSAALSPIDAARSPGEDEPMESVVRYKFKSSTMEYSVAFSGPHIGVLELKKAIVTEQNMSAGSEAILELTRLSGLMSIVARQWESSTFWITVTAASSSASAAAASIFAVLSASSGCPK